MPPDIKAPADFSIRPARADDALCLGVLGLQVYLDTYATEGIRPTVARAVLAAFSTEAMAAVLAAPHTTVIVAEQVLKGDMHLVGFAQLERGATQPLAQAAWPHVLLARLDRLYVQEPLTRRGLGARLLQAAEAEAASGGAAAMWLTAWVHNHRALAFYARQGWADLGSTLYRIEHETHDNRVLGRALQ